VRIRTQCRECGYPFGAEIDRSTVDLSCPACDHKRTVDTSDWTADTPTLIERCAICACKHLYQQKDVNRALGCAILLVGIVFVPWTYGLSLVALSLVDLVLYWRLPLNVVCYKCDTAYRDARPSPRQNEFDLLKHDVLKYGKTWQDVDT